MNITHAELVAKLVKPGKEILDEMVISDAHLTHMALGVCGEAGELADAIKKKTIYQKSLDIKNIIEELGDLEFYMEGIRQCLNISRGECLEHNIKKLSIRYKDLQYSNAAAVKREDKIVCPKCSCANFSRLHHQATFGLPETDYLFCNDCNHNWVP